MRRARAILLGLACVSCVVVSARADDEPAKVALSRATDTPLDGTPIHRPRGLSATRANGSHSGGWWFSSAGIVLVLAILGGGSLAAKHWRLIPGSETGPLEIVGRTFLTPKHAVYLVRAGGRTLLIGTGPQGAPSLLGELSETTPAPVGTHGGPR
jgi:hypothetical protein